MILVRSLRVQRGSSRNESRQGAEWKVDEGLLALAKLGELGHAAQYHSYYVFRLRDTTAAVGRVATKSGTSYNGSLK
jgi:hypothetical protein